MVRIFLKILFQTDPSSLGLIIYQDSFEVANPLGSARKKHKLLAVYLTLSDILPHNRSNIDHMQLVLLCNEQDFKYFGPAHVFRTLIEDLKDLEENGVVVNDAKTLKASLCSIVGDNLGSHMIGGFVENFSRSLHFCRYCTIERDSFHATPLEPAMKRTVESYERNIQELATSGDNVVGVKFNSPFNQLNSFHVCQPGLPPCLGHDLFEGVVASDLKLYIDYLVNQEKFFTFTELNCYIKQFKYTGNDAANKPAEVNSGSEKVCGHAVHNWCLLRLLPVIVGHRIKDPESEVWQLVLLLRQIVDLICAPAILADQVAYLKVLIDEYIHFRYVTFPSKPLKPKHHYLCHYPELIKQFGPLTRLWTMWFESKHTYFKQCARKLRNLNVCATLAERHQLLQAYLSAGNLFQLSV